MQWTGIRFSWCYPYKHCKPLIAFLFNEEKMYKQFPWQKSVTSAECNSATAFLHQAAKLDSHYLLYEYWIGALCPYRKCIRVRRTGRLLCTQQERQHKWSVFVFYHSCKCQDVIYIDDISKTFHLWSKWPFSWSQLHLYKCKVTCGRYIKPFLLVFQSDTFMLLV